MNSSGPNPGATLGTRIRGQWPEANWEIDYTEIKLGPQSLRVFMDTFSGWVDAYPIKETVTVVAKTLLEDIIPRYGLPTLLGSDNGTVFISQVTQSSTKFLGTN